MSTKRAIYLICLENPGPDVLRAIRTTWRNNHFVLNDTQAGGAVTVGAPQQLLTPTPSPPPTSPPMAQPPVTQPPDGLNPPLPQNQACP